MNEKRKEAERWAKREQKPINRFLVVLELWIVLNLIIYRFKKGLFNT